MDKEVAKEIREQKRREREDKMAKCVTDSLTPNEEETQWLAKSHVRKQTTMDTFHKNFIASLRAHTLLHRGVNLGVGLDS